MVPIREPAVAGSFYPSDPDELRTAVQDLLDAARIVPGPPPCALVAPHAGYVYSGAVAASAYAQLLPHRGRYRRVALLGPAHRVPVSGLALPGVELFRTPLGLVPVGKAAFDQLGRSTVTVNPAAHRREHCLEVQLPFLQVVLGAFKMVPLLVGVTEPATVAAAIQRLWRDEGTLVVVSTDLSHYLDYETAGRRDGGTRAAVETPVAPPRRNRAVWGGLAAAAVAGASISRRNTPRRGVRPRSLPISLISPVNMRFPSSPAPIQTVTLSRTPAKSRRS